MHKPLTLILVGMAVCYLPRNCLAVVPIPVTLSGLPVDSVLPTFTDPGSGVAFSNPSTPAGGNFFIVDYWNALASLPTLSPGLVVGSNGFVGNGGVSAPYQFSFTMTFPVPASEVDMTMAYENLHSSPPTTITLQGFDPDGNQVASTTVTPPFSSLVEQPLSLTAGANGITRVTVTPTNLSDAFGRISFTPVPEPSAFALAALGAATLYLARCAGAQQKAPRL